MRARTKQTLHYVGCVRVLVPVADMPRAGGGSAYDAASGGGGENRLREKLIRFIEGGLELPPEQAQEKANL